MVHDDGNDPTFGLLAEDDEALTQHLCAECGVMSPPTRTAYTLIGKAHGWRVTRYPAPPRPGVVGKSWRFEWHCPTCWPAVKSARGDAMHADEMGGDEPHAPGGAPGSDGPTSRRR